MSKQAKMPAVLDANGPAAVAQADDVRALRTFSTGAPKSRPDALFAAGHNVVIDRRNKEELVIRIGTDQDALGAILQPLKADGTLGAKFLARTEGGRFNSVTIDIGGKPYFLSCTLQAYEPKAKK